jgi:transcriptional regulator with XRE-family HTH domain
MHTMKFESTQLTIDATRLQREIRARGFTSVKNFADSIGVHRNTVGNYLSGKTALPGALARILDALDLAPAEVLTLTQRRKNVPGLPMISLKACADPLQKRRSFYSDRVLAERRSAIPTTTSVFTTPTDWGSPSSHDFSIL